MLPLLLAGLAMAALGLFLYWKLTKGEGENSSSSFFGSGDSESGSDQSQNQNKLREERSRRNNLIDRLVDSIKFASREMVTQNQVQGSRPRKSIVPTGNYNVRPLRGVAEFASLLPSSHMLDDNHFYAQLATNKLMVGEFIEYHGKAHNTLVVAVDGSGSMENSGRVQWSMGLVERLIDRCIEIGAEMFFVVFSDYIRGSYHVFDKKSAEEIRGRLGSVLSPRGGTDINITLKKIFEIVDEGKFAEARILLVTDGTEGVDEENILKELSKRKIFLHTVCIAGEREDLKRISSEYDRLGMYG